MRTADKRGIRGPHTLTRTAHAHAHRTRLCGVPAVDAIDGRVENGVLLGRRFAEIDVRLVDLDVRRQTFPLDGVAGGREVARVRQPQPASIGQTNELLEARAAERAL